MNKRRHQKLVHEESYVAEVDIELLETGEGWSPYLSLEDAAKLDDVRIALRSGDIAAAGKLARVYHLSPVSIYCMSRYVLACKSLLFWWKHT